MIVDDPVELERVRRQDLGAALGEAGRRQLDDPDTER